MMQNPYSKRLRLNAIFTAIFASFLVLPTLAQTPPAGPRPPLPANADWITTFEYHLLEGPEAQVVGAVGKRIERKVAAPPTGKELMLLRTEYASRYEQELVDLRANAQSLSHEFDLENGLGREILQLSDGRIRVIESWMTPPFFIRAAVATAATKDEALKLIALVEKIRRKGLYGGPPLLHSPSIAP